MAKTLLLFRTMRLLSKLIIAGGLFYLGARYGRPLLRQLREKLEGEDFDDDDLVAEEVVVVGIAAVDPEPLSTMGEAVDPDAIAAAHQEVPDQLEQLPVRGKNVP